MITSLEDESSVKLKVILEQEKIDNLQSELSIKERQMMKMKGVEQRLVQSKLMLHRIEGKLNSGINILTSLLSKLCSEYNFKLGTIEKKFSIIFEMLDSLQPKLLNFKKQLYIQSSELPNLQSDNFQETEELKSIKEELTGGDSEAAINSDIKVVATSQSQPHPLSQVMKKASEKEILGK